MQDANDVERNLPFVAELAASESTVPSSRVSYTPRREATDLWTMSGDSTISFDSPPIEESLASAQDIIALADRFNFSSTTQELNYGDCEFSDMICMTGSSGTAVDLNFDVDLDPCTGVLAPTPLERFSSPTSSLMRFREKMDQQIPKIDAYYSNPHEVLQGCKEEGAAREPGNPAAMLLLCSKEFTEIIESLTKKGGTGKQDKNVLDTEIVLLALSSYLSLMRFFDVIFHTIHKFISQMPPETFKSIKVKSVLLISGVSSLQDMSLKIYATGIIDAIQCQVRALERCMGIPREYCLVDDETVSSPMESSGIFSSADRASLFRAVLAQDDIKSRQGSKSYVESMKFIHD
jgi:hypothetical protein